MTTNVRSRFSFEAYLRTGRLVAPNGLEHKFNPNHDPQTGKFTFADWETAFSAANEASGGQGRTASKQKTIAKKVSLTPEQYNAQAKSLWGDMEGDPRVGFQNDKQSNAAGVKAQLSSALSNADLEASAAEREAVTAVADSTRRAELQGDQNFEKTLTFERLPDGQVVVASIGLPGQQGGSVAGITDRTIAVAHVHYIGMDQSPFRGDNSPVRVRNLPSFVIEGETGRVWEIGRQSGQYVQRLLGKRDKVGHWQPFQQ